MRSRRAAALADQPKLGFFRRRRTPGVIEARVRVDRRTKDLLLRLRPGEIAVIAHDDLDAVAAEALVDQGAAAVVNCRRSITGRYPNAGPLSIVRAGVPLIDNAGEQLLERVKEGDRLRIEDGRVMLGEDLVAVGAVRTVQDLEAALADAKDSFGEELDRFVQNTMDYLRVERDLVLAGEGMPRLRTSIDGRPVVVVVRGHEYRKDLRALRGYIAEMKPVLVAVDGAADTVLEEGWKPDVIVGDMDSVSTEALTCGAEVVVHAYPDGRAPGIERMRALGIDALLFPSAGTSEDIALLLAYEHDADLIVAVGAHDNIVEFLDKGRGGMASTFIVRLKVGPKLVDAKRVNRLYRSQLRTRDYVLLLAGMAGAWVATAFASPAMRLWLRGVGDSIGDFFRTLF